MPPRKRVRTIYLVAVEFRDFGVKKWVVMDGPPDKTESEILYEWIVDDGVKGTSDVPFIKNLPTFKADDIYTANIHLVNLKKKRKKHARNDTKGLPTGGDEASS